MRSVIIIFVLTLGIYLLNLPIDYSKSIETRVPRRLLTSNDVTSATFIPYEIIKYKTLHFSKNTEKAMSSAQVYEPVVYSVIRNTKGQLFSSMPIEAGILAIPIYFLPIMLNKIPTLNYYENIVNVLTLGRIAASFYTAIAVSIGFLILKELDKLKGFKTTAWTYIFTAFFAFGTNAYAIASRALYQHTSSLLFVTLIIYFLLKSVNNDKYTKYLGAFAGLLYIARPLNIVFVISLTIYVFFKHKKQFSKYILYAMPFAILITIYNLHAWGIPFTTEYVEKGDTSFSTPLWYGLTGYLISPARSFLFISPPLALGYYAMITVFKNKQKSDLNVIFKMLSITFLIILIMYSQWHDWSGGDRFGYGFLTEWIPIMLVLSYAQVRQTKRIGRFLILILITWSFYVQINAVWARKSRCSSDAHNWSFYCLKPLLFTKQNY